MTPNKILLVHLVSNGDCLYVTAIARQIKKDYPGCKLTWIISNLCSQVLLNNQYVDEIIEWKVPSVKDALFGSWYAVMDYVKTQQDKGIYQKVFCTQFFPENLHCFDGTIRSSLLRTYPWKKGMDVTPHISLTETETQNALNFVESNRLHAFSKVILFECSPGSGQSFMDAESALRISGYLLQQFPDMLIVLSTHLTIETGNHRILVANGLSFRENAELANHCHLFIGASSGISWLLTSDWIKQKIPTIQLLKRAKGISFASMKYDFKYWGLPHAHIVEIFTPDQGRIIDCVKLFFENGIHACVDKYNETIKPDPFGIKDFFNIVAKKRKPGLLFKMFTNFYERNGFSLRFMLAALYIPFQAVFRIPKVLLKGEKAS